MDCSPYGFRQRKYPCPVSPKPGIRSLRIPYLPKHNAIPSRILWDELAEKLRDKFGLAVDELPLLDLYRRHATWVAPQPLATPVCRDADDDWVIATALAGQAEAIVTGDGDLLELGAYEGISILSPRQFLERLVQI